MNCLECNSCRHKSYTFDNFMDLSVSIPCATIRTIGQIDLKACMETYIKSEKMDKGAYKCIKCKAVTNSTKDFSIYRFPKILVIQLKRLGGFFKRRQKFNDTIIKIPSNYDFSIFAPHSSKNLPIIISNLDHESKKCATY